VATDKNKLYYGDNLEVLKRNVKDEKVDLVYLDPPFISRQDYNVLFAEKDVSQSSSCGAPTDRSSSVGWRDSCV
jgi:16S rRNA G966 N2-methylase RsmD